MSVPPRPLNLKKQPGTGIPAALGYSSHPISPLFPPPFTPSASLPPPLCPTIFSNTPQTIGARRQGHNMVHSPLPHSLWVVESPPGIIPKGQWGSSMTASTVNHDLQAPCKTPFISKARQPMATCHRLTCQGRSPAANTGSTRAKDCCTKSQAPEVNCQRRTTKRVEPTHYPAPLKPSAMLQGTLSECPQYLLADARDGRGINFGG